MIAFPASFCIMFLSDGIATSISKRFQSLLLIFMSGLFARISVSVCLCPLVPSHCYVFLFSHWRRHVWVPVFCFSA